MCGIGKMDSGRQGIIHCHSVFKMTGQFRHEGDHYADSFVRAGCPRCSEADRHFADALAGRCSANSSIDFSVALAELTEVQAA